MTDDLRSYLFPIDAHLLRYLDVAGDPSLSTVEHLYRYAVALLQGLVRPEDVKEDWEDFFYLFLFLEGLRLRLRLDGNLDVGCEVDGTVDRACTWPHRRLGPRPPHRLGPRAGQVHLLGQERDGRRNVDAMTDDLFSYLIGVSSDALRKVQCYAVALIQRLITPEHVHEDWPDFFSVVEAFVLACGTPRLGYLAGGSSLFVGDGNDPVTEADRAFLVQLVVEMHERLSEREA